MMNFEHAWRDAENAAGFASACTRLSYISAEGRSCADTHDSAVRAFHAAQNAQAAQINESNTDGHIAQASHAANLTAKRATGGRACHTELTQLYVRWVLKDLVGNRVIDENLRLAAGAAIAGGNEDLAVELLEMTQ